MLVDFCYVWKLIYPTSFVLMFSKDSLVIVVIGCGINGWKIGVHYPGRGDIFLLTTTSSIALGPTQPPIQWVLEALFQRIMCLEREAEYKYMYVTPFSAAFERKFCIRVLFTPCAPITLLTVFSLITRTLHPTKFPGVCHRPELIAIFTTTFCCTVSRARRRHLKTSHPISVRFILVLSSFQRLEPDFISHLLHVCYMTSTHIFNLDLIILI